jgi:hypothetical protein
MHNPDFRGTTVEIYGSKGSAKTTLMLKIASRIVCTYDFTNWQKEPVIWRGRTVDMWTWYPGKVRVFVHADDDPYFTTESGEELKVRLIKYEDIRDVLNNLNEFNVVYEPTTYQLGDNLKEMIARRAAISMRQLNDIDVDSTVWWFETIYEVLKRKDNRFISLFFDEADELFPENPSGLRWHLQAWLKDSVKDLRKRNISMYYSAHSHTDVDSRIRTKMQYRILMKGARVPNNSLINKRLPLFLDVGEAIIERDGFGKFRFDKLRRKEVVVVHFS